jgi:DNA replication and repair protein RecF
VHVTRIALTDFRSYAAADVHLGPGVTGFMGPNGHGKTNLVEAIGYASTLGSHRSATDAPLVRRGAERAIVRVQIDSASTRTLVELEINPGRANRARVNRAPVRQARQIIGVLRTVTFAPEDLALVKGDPAHRRRFLDDLLVARWPRFAGVRADYERVLKQRSALLKSAGVRAAARGGHVRSDGVAAGMLTTLDTWDQYLVTVGAELLAGRLSLVAELRPLVAAAYARLADGKGGTSMRYRQSLASTGGAAETEAEPPADAEALAACLRKALAGCRAAELERGVCLAGPHRDDLALNIGDMPARGYASHGESWSLALALRLASYHMLRADGDEPVLLLDDVFAELDPGRSERLATLAVAAEQALVTAAASAHVPEGIMGARFTIRDGAVERAW